MHELDESGLCHLLPQEVPGLQAADAVQNGAQLRSFPREVLDATYDAALNLYSELRDSEPDWGPIYDSQIAFQAEHFLWQQVAESTFAQFMQDKQSAGELPGQQN